MYEVDVRLNTPNTMNTVLQLMILRYLTEQREIQMPSNPMIRAYSPQRRERCSGRRRRHLSKGRKVGFTRRR